MPFRRQWGGGYGSARQAAHDNIISNFSRTENVHVFPIFAKSSFLFIGSCTFRGKFFQKPRSHPEVLGTRMITWSKFNTKDPPTYKKKLVARATRRPGLVYPRSLLYLLTPWCRLLLEKLTGLQLVKKFLAFHGTGRFITALTSIRHLSLSWASPIQSIYPHSTSWISILILSTHLRLGLPSGHFPSVSPPRPYTPPSPHPYAPHAQPISFTIL